MSQQHREVGYNPLSDEYMKKSHIPLPEETMAVSVNPSAEQVIS